MDQFPRRTPRVVLGAILVVFIILLAAVAVSALKKTRMPKIDSNAYQAVFLEGNIQYFGHLHGLGTKYPYLTDVYYVQAQELHPEDPAKSKFTLIKLGNEIHGPQDVVYLNWAKVLFWENLKSDSQVVKNIMLEKTQRAQQVQK